MGETQRMLERAGERFEMPEPAMDRLVRHRERRERAARLEAAVVGLSVAAAGIIGAVVTLRVAGRTAPGSGGSGTEAAGGGGFVLPTVAIWTALVVLGLTVLAAARLRGRLKHVGVGQDGREPGGTAASAGRPAAVPDAAPREGGIEMDSSPTTGVGVPQPEMPSIRFDDGKLQRTNRWLIGAVIVLAVAVVALGVALIASSTEETPAPPAAQPTTEGLADSAIADSLEDWFTAQNTGAPVGDFYAEDAVLELRNESPPQVLRGRERIVAHYEPSPGTAIPSSVVAMPSTDVLQVGDFAVVGYSYPGGGGFALTRFDGDLKIVHQWVVGW